MTTTHYLDGFQYIDDKLEFFPTAEGYVKATHTSSGGLGGGTTSYNYVFNYTDHPRLREEGNIRLRYAINPVNQWLEILEEDHYYPFGLKHQGYNAENYVFATLGGGPVQLIPTNPDALETYKYKYNGFEYQDELGLRWYDYLARNYDPAIGRWFNIDPASELSRRNSPYAYALNNPVFWIDPDGMMATPPLDYYDNKGNKIGTDGVSDGRKAVVTDGKEVRAIKKIDKKGGTTQLGDVNSAKVLPSNVALNTSLEVLSDTKSTTSSDDIGGLHGESAIVFKDGSVVRGESGGKGVVTADGAFQTTESLPNLPDGKTVSDIEATVHSHATNAFEQDGKIYGGDATQPSERDNKNSTFIGTTSIIVGPLGHPTGQQQLNKSTGKMEVNITKQPNGIVIYKNGTEQLRLTEKAVRKIIN